MSCTGSLNKGCAAPQAPRREDKVADTSCSQVMQGCIIPSASGGGCDARADSRNRQLPGPAGLAVDMAVGAGGDCGANRQLSLHWPRLLAVPYTVTMDRFRKAGERGSRGGQTAIWLGCHDRTGLMSACAAYAVIVAVAGSCRSKARTQHAAAWHKLTWLLLSLFFNHKTDTLWHLCLNCTCCCAHICVWASAMPRTCAVDVGVPVLGTALPLRLLSKRPADRST